MSEQEPKSDLFAVRMSPEAKQQLVEQASRFGKPSEVVRAILQAWMEGRVTIVPPSDQKESLYAPRKLD